MNALLQWLSTRLIFDEGAGIPADIGPIWGHLVFWGVACALVGWPFYNLIRHERRARAKAEEDRQQRGGRRDR